MMPLVRLRSPRVVDRTRGGREQGPGGSQAVSEPASLAAAQPTVDLSVLVPVYNEEEQIRESVTAMLAQDFDGLLELLLVDGRSNDRTAELLSEMQADDDRIRILDNPDRTVTTGLNIGLRAARGRYVARMDAHTVYPGSYLRQGVARLQQGDVAWVTGPQVPQGRGYWSRLVATALSSGLGRGPSDKWRAHGEGPDEEWELTTSVFTGVWHRTTLDELGGWDPAWVVNEDSEMAARLLAGGARIVCRGDMGALYTPRDSLPRLARQYWRYGTFRARTLLRHPGSCGPLRAGVSLLPAGLATALLPGPVGRIGRLLAGVYALAVTGQVARIRPRMIDAGPLAAVLVTMHLAWGGGFSSSIVRLLPHRSRIRRRVPVPLDRPSA